MDFHIPDDQGRHEVIIESKIIKTSSSLFEGSSKNMLSTMFLLLNFNMVHGLNNVFMDELFSLFHK